jgi:lipid II:glycine glycyltransferase (peptidoglycan interpeptide bridge formation enzyme)
MNESERELFEARGHTIKEQQAQIAQLYATLEEIDDHGRALEALDMIRAQATEIERLKDAVELMTAQAIEFRDLVQIQDTMIIELADALESIPIVLHPPHRKLVRRARELTRSAKDDAP